LKSVVLPAPLGPIRPTMAPLGTSKDTPSSATMPPKRTEMLLTLSRASPLAFGAARKTDCASMDGRRLPGSLPARHFSSAARGTFLLARLPTPECRIVGPPAGTILEPPARVQCEFRGRTWLWGRPIGATGARALDRCY